MSGRPGSLGDELERLANYLARRFAEGETLAEARERSPLRFAGLTEEEINLARVAGRAGAEALVQLTAFGAEEEIGQTPAGRYVLETGGLAQVTVGFGAQDARGAYQSYRTYTFALSPETTAQALYDAARARAMGQRSPGIDEEFSSAELTAILPFDLYSD